MTDKTDKYILVINCRSSSLKFSLYSVMDLQPQVSGGISDIGESFCQFKINKLHGQVVLKGGLIPGTMQNAVYMLVTWLKRQSDKLAAIGYRLVQGGPDHRDPALITDGLLKTFSEFIYLAPNHLKDKLNTIRIFR